MIDRKFCIIFIINVAAFFLCRCKTEEIILKGELGGYVKDASTNQPVQNATVILNPSSDTTYTGQDGGYFFKSLIPGSYNILVTKVSYFANNKSVDIYSANTQSVDFDLEKTPMRAFSVPCLDFGFDSTIKRFTISNMGTGNLYYLVVSNSNWINLTHSSGSGLLTTQPDTITVKINRTGLSPDKHKGSIIVWSNSGQSWIADSIFVFLNGVVDQDLNIYNVITIGSQTWMAENINVGSCNNVAGTGASGSDIKKHCYDNNEKNCTIYGGLYDLAAARNVCPAGWHLPERADWDLLINYLGGREVAGGKLKETGTNYWNSPNNATNESGFTARPGGAFFYNNYGDIGQKAYFWSSSDKPEGDPYSYLSYFISNSDVSIASLKLDYLYSLSVRCVKDQSK